MVWRIFRKKQKEVPLMSYLGFSSGTVDGKYGANTENAVKAFQTACVPRFGLTVDGIAGQATKEALIYPYAWSH